MTIRFYFDEMMSRDTEKALNAKGISVTMANDVEMTSKKDHQHLKYAHEHQLVLVTLDKKFAGLAEKHQNHSGVICWTNAFQNPGRQIKALEAFAKEYTAEQVAGNVYRMK